MPDRLTATEAPYTIGMPPFRPGDSPDFGGAFVEQPGDLSRPPVDCEAHETAEHARGLIRVLDDNHVASGPWEPDIPDEELLLGLEHMLRLRTFDDRMMKMQRTGLLSFYMRSFGEEAIAVAQTMALEEQDWLFPSSVAETW
jgi:2-oxoisovalerate dehydrogenase E1 component alpha subunit